MVGMTVRWVFNRGDQQTPIDVVSLGETYAICVQDSNGIEQRTTLPSLLDAMLQQADLERALTVGGWQLAAFVRLPVCPATWCKRATDSSAASDVCFPADLRSPRESGAVSSRRSSFSTMRDCVDPLERHAGNTRRR
jgi:hypothetical protein